MTNVQIGGLTLAAITRDQAVSRVFDALSRNAGGWIITANLDYLERYSRDPTLHALYAKADLIVADGVPILWAARLLGAPLPDRVAGSDLVGLLAERCAGEARALYLLGGNHSSAQRAARRLCGQWPGLRICGVTSPQVSEDPTQGQLREIRAELAQASPDIVLVALGAPKEERVISALRRSLPSIWWLGVGISLSFTAGDLRRAPRWMQSMGLEWLHRLCQEPKRLSSRYLVRGLPFAVRLLVSAYRARP